MFARAYISDDLGLNAICIEIGIGVFGEVRVLIRGWFTIHPAYFSIIVIIELSGYLGNNVNIILIMITVQMTWKEASTASEQQQTKVQIKKCNECAPVWVRVKINKQRKVSIPFI